MLDYVNLNVIHEGPHFRKVWKDSPEYQYLALSVRKHGVLMPILVKEIHGGYQIIKGQRRFQAAKDADQVHIPVHIIHATNIEELQVILSTHHLEPKPIEYGQAILKLCKDKITLMGMAKKLSKDPQWIRNVLGLDRLCPKATELVNTEKIILANANILTRLDEEDQLIFLNDAVALRSHEFDTKVFIHVKNKREAQREKYRGKIAVNNCVAHVHREFFFDGESDGTETEFIYEDDPIAESLRGCKTIEEVRVVLQEPSKDSDYWVVTQVQLKDRTIV